MDAIPLSKLVADKGLAAVARLFQVSAPAIKKAIDNDRDIRCVELLNGVYSAHEIRPFPFKPNKAA
ncbi:TPA: Cro/Cl family transcriptional regulator [Pseudomonas aeruginosa]|uniref:Cro/CI family transcriptional regulator n=1 Tax=Pseudomonas aeruginosa TaxID=287 RepID=UPI00249DCD25|nr:Cro/CI family transcriptional regulator [Pseudomonas aeruginosa]MDI4012901.1 Cro/CI family transcriptional regulator [Pseudomonas aeruginosa]MDI4025833.1 Cro/CI family transcriptional regulator [Pseudomonas aeruginosa]HBP5437374.1 Cro/Cl family transcriptional regulator [Pseudomonas aeruginosa]HCF9147842.1 Cro/Cl family transcriptional regulator [Pseudomonas aeruginosa]